VGRKDKVKKKRNKNSFFQKIGETPDEGPGIASVVEMTCEDKNVWNPTFFEVGRR